MKRSRFLRIRECLGAVLLTFGVAFGSNVEGDDAPLRPPISSASGNVSGTITLANSPFLIDADVFVPFGETLVIEAGVEIRFQDSNDDLFVDGDLIAQGTSGAPIVFTSDDAGKAPGQWGAIIFRGSTGSTIDHCIIEYGGGNQLENLLISGGNTTVRNTTIRHCSNRGMTILNSNSTVESCQFQGNVDYAVVMDTLSFPFVNNNAASGNGFDAIGILSGTVTGSGTWVNDTIPYTIISDVFVGVGAALRIAAGTTVQFQDTTDDLFVDGDLLAEGSDILPIIFTSDEAVKEPGQWGAVIVRGSGPSGGSVLDHCIVEYGGGVQLECIQVSSVPATITNTEVRFGKIRGISLYDSDSTVENCNFHDNLDYALVMDVFSFPILRNNVAMNNGFDAHGILGGTVTSSGVWVNDAVPYTVISDVFVGVDAVLTVEAGTTVQFQDNTDDLWVDGMLIADGEIGSKIWFTSDDEDKSSGQWGGITFRRTGGVASVLDHCIVEYGGGGSRNESLHLSSDSPSVTNCEVNNGLFRGITLSNSNGTITDCVFNNNVNYAIAMDVLSFPELRRNTATGNGFDATGILGGTTAEDGVWVNDTIPFTIISDVFVGADTVLTIEPGTVVQFQDSTDDLWIDGTLNAQGASGNEIRFTSDDDDKSPGQWGGITFRKAGGIDSVLDYCIVEYGGGSRNESVHLSSDSPSITNCEVNNSSFRGVSLSNSDGTITDCAFKNNVDYAIVIDVLSFPELRRNAANGNGFDATGILGGTTAEDGVWVNDTIPFTIISDVFVGADTVLTIEPGTIVQFQDSTDDLWIDGTLNARGLSGNKIRFTSDDDEKSSGQWGGITFRKVGGTDSILDYCIVEYGGGGSRGESVHLSSDSPSVTNCEINNSLFRGVTLNNSEGTITDCVIDNNIDYAIGIDVASFPELRRNTANGNGFDAIGIFGGTVLRDGVWVRDTIPYTIISDVFVVVGKKLTIEPGATIQFQDNSDDLFIDGALDATGLPTAPIIFTSDDAVKAPGQWGGITVRDSSDDAQTVFDYCIIEFGGAFRGESIFFDKASPTVNNSTVRNGSADGVGCSNAAPQLSNCRLIDNARDGLRTFSGGQPVVINSVIAENEGHGVNNLDTAVIIDAQSNYWGDSSGPFDVLDDDGLGLTNPDGLGDSVSEYVNWANFLTAEPGDSEESVLIAVSPVTLGFGDVEVDDEKELVLEIQSNGTEVLTVSNVSSDNARFTFPGLSLPIQIDAGATEDVIVRFTPESAETVIGNITINSNATNDDSLTVALNGNGVSPAADNIWLSIDREGDDFVLSWPVNDLGLILETTLDLSPPAAWTLFDETVNVVDEQNRVIFIPLTDQQQQFFRLQHPMGNPVRVTFDHGNELHPAWDPRGTTIAFTTDREPGDWRDVGAVESDGTNERLLAKGPQSPFGLANSHVSWVGSTGRLMVPETVVFHEYLSFDVSKAPFTRTVNDNNDAAFSRKLLVDGGGGGGYCFVSRDGSTVLWRYSSSGGGGLTTIRSAAFSSLSGQSASSAGTVIISENVPFPNQKYNEGAALFPDGSKCVVPIVSGAGFDLFIYNTDGTGTPFQLTTTGASSGALNRFPDVSPDGTKVAFTYYTGVEGDSNDIAVINIDGSGFANLTPTSDLSEVWPTWSPDGSSIAFSRHDTEESGALAPGEPANRNIYVLRVE